MRLPAKFVRRLRGFIPDSVIDGNIDNLELVLKSLAQEPLHPSVVARSIRTNNWLYVTESNKTKSAAQKFYGELLQHKRGIYA